MVYEPLPKRRNLRLRDFDYASAGAYFVTICTYQRRALFGSVAASRMCLSDAGRLVDSLWREVNSRSSAIRLDEWAVMPDHVHGILFLEPNDAAPHLSRVIGEYKSVTTRAYFRLAKEEGGPPLEGRLWQRGYFDHVIRDNQSLMRIREYIRSNPVRLDLEQVWMRSCGIHGRAAVNQGTERAPTS